MIEKAKKVANLITWLRSLVAGNREESSRHGFFEMRNAFRRAARQADRDQYLELWCGVKVEK
jgi:hypothetical protein